MTDIPEPERVLLAGAERRLGRMILLLIPLGTVIVGGQWGGAVAGAFVLGGVLAYLNYRWIVAVVDGLMEGQRARVPRRTYLKVYLPLALLGILLYGIFSRSWVSPAGFLGGLSLLVAAVLLEAIYEIALAVGK